jgi:pyruvate,orthophosphate dikinase
MVFGNPRRPSAPGSPSPGTRPPARREPYGDFLVNAQGEDVVAGIRATDPLVGMADRFPRRTPSSSDVFSRLERHYRDMCDVEFTVEQDRLWILQTRAGKRSGAAACASPSTWSPTSTSPCRCPRPCGASPPTTWSRCCPPAPGHQASAVLTTGLGASPGAGRGRVYLTPDDAIAAADRGEDVILVRSETSPEDVHGMMVSRASSPPAGGLVSHAAVVARGLGHACGSSAPRPSRSGRTGSPVATSPVAEGDVISLDGSTGEVLLGDVGLGAVDDAAELESCSAGPTTSGGVASACGPTPTPPTTPDGRASCGGASACAGRSTCSSARSGCPSCGP